jgi:hypothetical protein
VLILVLAGVGYGAYWAFHHAFNGFQPPLTSQSTGAPATAATGTGDASGASTPTDEARPVIESGQSLDPQGVAQGNTAGEHPEAAPLAYDGAPETFWYTRTYATANFGGLRSGVGYAITLQQAAKVSSIVLSTNNTGGNVEVRATTPDKPTDGPVLASGPLAAETELTFAEPVASQTFVLWFTELPLNPKGKYRVELNEILIS